MSYKIWNIEKHNKQAAVALSEETDLPAFLCLLMQSAGIFDAQAAQDFLYAENLTFSDPFLLQDMEKAVKRINRAVENGEKIAVYGDYDADGVTATALLYSHLEAIGADVMYYIPQRMEEGYGLNQEAIRHLSGKGVNLIVTVDNGITAVQETAYALSLGMDVVITDHHQPSDILPDACAVVDPHREDDCSGMQYLSGVGVAFKLVCAMDPENVAFLLSDYADLLAIGTVADIVPLLGENRSFVIHGIRSMENGERPGIKSILKCAGIEGKAITAGTISFAIAPRINASGRVNSPENAIKLLLSESFEESDAIAQEIERVNCLRQELEQDILSQAEEMIAEHPEIVGERIIVLYGNEWHQGVIGIVASRITEKYGKPCFVISCGENIAKGSGRSIPGFSLYDALFACKEDLLGFGGHKLAAGISVDPKSIKQFAESINAYAAQVEQMPVPVLHIACVLNPEKITVDVVETIKFMAPFGQANPTPVFVLKQMKLSRITPVGGGKHLKLLFTYNNTAVTAMKFSTKPEDFAYREGDVVDLAVTLDKNEYRGVVQTSIQIKDMRFTNSDMEQVISANRLCEALMRGESIEREDSNLLYPARDEMAAVYRFLIKEKGFRGQLDIMAKRLQNNGVLYSHMLAGLLAMRELGLICWKGAPDCSEISVLPVAAKVALENSSILKKLREIS